MVVPVFGVAVNPVHVERLCVPPMDIHFFLVCHDHSPHLRSEYPVGEEKDFLSIVDYVRHRDTLILDFRSIVSTALNDQPDVVIPELYRKGYHDVIPEGMAEGEIPITQRAVSAYYVARFLSQHPNCEVSIVDEFGEEYWPEELP